MIRQEAEAQLPERWVTLPADVWQYRKRGETAAYAAVFPMGDSQGFRRRTSMNKK